LHDWDMGDRASSIRVMGSGCKVQLNPDFEHDGNPWYFGEGEYNCDMFSKMADSDSASWMRIWHEVEHHNCYVTLFDECGYGHEVTFHEGDYSLHDWDMGDRASSIRVMGSGCKVQLNPDSEHDGNPWYFGEGEYNCDMFSKMADSNSASWMRVSYTPPKCMTISREQGERLGALPCRK